MQTEIMELLKTVGAFGTFAFLIVYAVLNSKAVSGRKNGNGKNGSLPPIHLCPLSAENLITWQEQVAKTVAVATVAALAPTQVRISEQLAVVINKQETKERMLQEIEHQQTDVIETNLQEVGKVLSRIVENQSNFLSKMQQSQERIVELLIRLEERLGLAPKS